MAAHQSTFEQYQGRAVPGLLAYPQAPRFIKRGVLNAAAAAGNVRPGDFVYRTNDGWVKGTTAAHQENYGGIVVLRSGVVAESGTAAVSGKANSPNYVEYKNDDAIDVLLTGFCFVTAGSTSAFGDLMNWQTDRKWDTLANDVPSAAGSNAANILAFVQALKRNPVRLMDDSAAENDIVVVSIGLGGPF